MQAQAILEQYQALSSLMHEANLPALEAMTYHLTVETKTLTTVEAVYAALDSFNPISGWIGYQSGNQYFVNEPWAFKSDYGVLLNAEMTNGSGVSLHVRYNGNGGWVVTQYHYGKGEEYVADTVKHLASFDNGNTTLRYLRFWKVQDGSLGVNPVFACFVGFGGKE
jgi:hypothetical protein